jgi:hypothetical protein
MRLARLERLVARAERLAAEPDVEQMLKDAGQVEIGGGWLNPFHFVDAESLVRLMRAIRDAEKRGDKAELQRLDEAGDRLFAKGVAAAIAKFGSPTQ